jgi:hypothetical protein
MKSLREQLSESLLVEDDSIIKTETSADLSDMNTSSVPDTDYTFKNSKFNRDISKWTVRDVKGMSFTF